MNTEDFVSFVEALDRCWREGRFEELHAFLAEDIVLVAPGGEHRIGGVTQAIDSYRQFVSHARVDRFATSGYEVTQRGDTSIIEYKWEMAWVASEEAHEDVGREVLVLARRNGDWRVVWRTQIPVSK